MAFTFLSARWANLCMLNYAVPAGLLDSHVPLGLTLDQRDGAAFVSIVAFDFLDTRVLGVPWPGFRNFVEWNLRFYVRRGAERGVVFIREFVPQRLVALTARLVYNEPYSAARLRCARYETLDEITVEHRLEHRGRTHRLAMTGARPPVEPPAHSTEHFFKEHRWGFGVGHSGRTQRYEVAHPVWQVYPVRQFQLDLDWAALYGPEWGVMQGREPHSAVFAVGSPVQVYLHQPLRREQGQGLRG